MSKSNPSYRRPLNDHQILLIQTLYKFRFATADLIARSQQAKHKRVIADRLKILVDQKYIGMNYDSSYRIIGKPATYYLLEAIRYLKQQSYADERTLRSVYHDRRASDNQIAHRLFVFDVYVNLKQQYPDRFKFFSKSELSSRSYMPNPKPDAYLQDVHGNKEYLLECLRDDMSFWVIKKTIKKYIYYAERETWQKSQDRPIPSVLLVCESEKLKKRIESFVSKELDNTYASLSFGVVIKSLSGEQKTLDTDKPVAQ